MRSNRPFAVACKSHASQTPCERQFLVLAWCARGVRSASRCGSRRAIRPHLCVAFESATQMRSDRPFAAAAACKSR
eukprot:11191785-Lingulodinium_polyedra.AAC.1